MQHNTIYNKFKCSIQSRRVPKHYKQWKGYYLRWYALLFWLYLTHPFHTHHTDFALNRLDNLWSQGHPLKSQIRFHSCPYSFCKFTCPPAFFYSLKPPSCYFHCFSKACQNKASAPTIDSGTEFTVCQLQQVETTVTPTRTKVTRGNQDTEEMRMTQVTLQISPWGLKWNGCDWVAPLEVDIIPTFLSPSHTTIPNYLAATWLICQVKMAPAPEPHPSTGLPVSLIPAVHFTIFPHPLDDNINDDKRLNL